MLKTLRPCGLMLLLALPAPAAGGAVTGRFVRVERVGGIVSLAELEVYVAGRNVARQATATQSSTVFGGLASRAVDGNGVGTWAGGSVTHTAEETNGGTAWWECDLGAEWPIEAIALYNRSDTASLDRLKGAVLSVLGSGRRAVFTAVITNTVIIPLWWVFKPGADLGPRRDSAYPSLTLTNGELRALVYLPDPQEGFARGPRFDRSAVVARLHYRGHTWFGTWHYGLHDAEDANAALGIGGDFGTGQNGTHGALGYETAAPGGPFLRIGVGELLKPERPEYSEYNPRATHAYRLSYRYPVSRVHPWVVTRMAHGVEFTSTAQGPMGWGYCYTRRLTLSADPPALRSECILENTGTRPILQSYYNHNFIMIDEEPVGPDYQLTFAFAPQVKDLSSNPPVSLNTRRWTFTRPLAPTESVGAWLSGFSNRAADTAFEVWHLQRRAGLRVSMDLAPAAFNIYCTARVVCPEPIVTLDVPPGQRRTWRTLYELKVETPR